MIALIADAHPSQTGPASDWLLLLALCVVSCIVLGWLWDTFSFEPRRDAHQNSRSRNNTRG